MSKNLIESSLESILKEAEIKKAEAENNLNKYISIKKRNKDIMYNKTQAEEEVSQAERKLTETKTKLTETKTKLSAILATYDTDIDSSNKEVTLFGEQFPNVSTQMLYDNMQSTKKIFLQSLINKDKDDYINSSKLTKVDNFNKYKINLNKYLNYLKDISDPNISTNYLKVILDQLHKNELEIEKEPTNILKLNDKYTVTRKDLLTLRKLLDDPYNEPNNIASVNTKDQVFEYFDILLNIASTSTNQQAYKYKKYKTKYLESM